MNIGDIIKTNRKEQNLTQKQLAKLINKSERTIQSYEGNKIIPPYETLKNLSDILQFDINSVFTPTPTPSDTIQTHINRIKTSTKNSCVSNLSIERQQQIALIVGNAFKDFLQIIDSSYRSMDSYVLADIAQSREFNEFLEYLYFKYTKENIEGDIDGNKEK